MSSDDLCTCGHPDIWHLDDGCQWSDHKADYPAPGFFCPCTAYAPARQVSVTERECTCAGSFTQSVHESNAEGHQVGCPRWGMTYAEFARQHLDFTTEVSVTDTIENVLDLHRRDGVTCLCGADMGRPRERGETGFQTKFDHDKHRKHVAAVIAQRLEAK